MMRIALILGLLWGVAGLSGAAHAQGCGPQNPNCIVPTAPPGTSNNQAASTAYTQGELAAIYTAAHYWPGGQSFNPNVLITPTPGLAGDAALTINNNTANISGALPGTIFHLVGANATGVRITYDSFGGQNTFTARRANGTMAAPSALLANQTIFTESAFGYGATGYSPAGRVAIAFNAAQNWTDTVQPTNMIFQTTAATPSAGLVTGLTVFPSGGAGVGASVADPGINNMGVAGIYIANGVSGVSCSGAPTAAFASVGGIVTHC